MHDANGPLPSPFLAAADTRAAWYDHGQIDITSFRVEADASAKGAEAMQRAETRHRSQTDATTHGRTAQILVVRFGGVAGEVGAAGAARH